MILARIFYFRSCSCRHQNLWPLCTPSLRSHITNKASRPLADSTWWTPPQYLQGFWTAQPRLDCPLLPTPDQYDLWNLRWWVLWWKRLHRLMHLSAVSFSSSLSYSFLSLSISISVSGAGPHNDRPAVYERTLPMHPLPVTSLFIGLYKPLA